MASAAWTTHYQGDSFALTGTIYSRYPIYEITVRVGDAAGDEILVSQTVNSEYRYPLANIDSQVMFACSRPAKNALPSISTRRWAA